MCHDKQLRENALKITILPEDAFCQIYLHEILSGILPLRYSVQGPSTILCCCPSRAVRDLVPSLNLGTWLRSSFPRAAVHRLSSTGHEAPPRFLLCCSLKGKRKDSHASSLFWLRIFSTTLSNGICKCN